MNKTKVQEAAAETADQIRIMVNALKARGFNEEQSIKLVGSMLSGSVVYAPFEAVATSNANLH